jgi:hydrogenase expression/formation protein HypC
MCQTIPVRVSRIEGDVAWVLPDGGHEFGLLEQPVSLLGVEGVAAGDYILHHAGLALTRIEPEEAETILALLEELRRDALEPWS